MTSYLPRLSEDGLRWARFLGVLLGIALLLWLAYALRSVLTPIAVALAIAYILNPVVNWLEEQGVRRLLSVTAGLIVLLVVAGLAITAGALQVVELSRQLPTYLEQLERWLPQVAPQLFLPETREALEPLAESQGVPDTVAPASSVAPATAPAASQPASAPVLDRDRLMQIAQRHGVPVAVAVWQFVLNAFSSATYVLLMVVLLPVYAFVFTLHFNEIIAWLRGLIPHRSREVVLYVFETIDRAMSDFFRGRLIVAVLVGLTSAIGWLIVGVPYSVAFGLLCIPLNLVPFLGPLILPPVLIATYLEAGGAWFMPVLLAFAIYMVVQALESFVLSPMVYSQSSGLHPVTTIVVFLVGAELLGVLGMLLAIPATSAIKSLASRFLMPELRRIASPPPQSLVPSLSPPSENRP